MIRLTAMLVVCIGITMVVAGRDIERPEGSDQPVDRIEVTRLEPQARSPLLRADAEAQAGEAALAIPLEDVRQAVQVAIAATEAGAPARPAPEPEQVATAQVEPPGSDDWFVTGNRVNLRAGPSTSTAVIGQVTLGQRARILDRTTSGWVRIETAEGGTTGFIFGEFLSQNRPL